MKPKILIMQAGGTPSQEKDNYGVYRPSNRNIQEILEDSLYLKELNSIANITIEDLFNIDSTNTKTTHRIRLAVNIYKKYKDYDAFVIIHGTDTMPDSAAALNYMLQNLGKPIVFTGSQKSLFEPASDAPNNLYNAVATATLDLGETVIVFGNQILRGVRAVKENEYKLNAFSSPRADHIGEIEKTILLKDHRIRRYEGEPELFTEFDTNVDTYKQSSGTTTNTFEYLVNNKEIHGIVVSAYGLENIEDRLIPHIEKATKLGKPILLASNCRNCRHESAIIYEVGLSPLNAGAISAGEMTFEAATQKLMYALGRANREGYNDEERVAFVRGIIHTDINRDITQTGDRFIHQAERGYSIEHHKAHQLEREVSDHTHIIFSGNPEDIRQSRQNFEAKIKTSLDGIASNTYDHGRNYEVPLEIWNKLPIFEKRY